MHKIIEVNMACPIRLPRLFNVVTKQAIDKKEISDCIEPINNSTVRCCGLLGCSFVVHGRASERH